MLFFLHSLFLLSANADCIHALASFGTNGHRFFVAVRINAFMSLLRHNDIHYARACQVFSIESWKIWFDMSIDFLLFDFRQNVYKWWCDWWKKKANRRNLLLLLFIFLLCVRFCSLHPNTRTTASMTQKSRFYGLALLSSWKFISSSNELLCQTKVKMKEPNEIYWPLFSSILILISWGNWNASIV